MNLLLTVAVALPVFGAVIFFHEMGHFLAAKWAKIKVNEFALGMGPRILKFGRGETVYALRLFPIGGFVSMEGEDEESGDERSFQKVPVYKRIVVSVAGAVMNLLLGFLVLVVLVGSGGVILTNTVNEVGYTESGLVSGDKIIKVNGRHNFIMADMLYEFARTQNGTFDLEIERGGERLLLEGVAFPTREIEDAEGKPVINEATGRPYEQLVPGFSVITQRPGPLNTLREAGANTLSYARLIYLTLFDLVTGKVPVNSLSGPVGIVSEIGKAAAMGWQPVLELLALISINLGVVNMLPLPALDGGRTLMLLVEAVRRKPIKQKYEIAINMAGFALLIALVVFISFNDIVRLIR